MKIVMLGAGGSGGHIAPHLYRLLYALERPVRFIICDGDIVEEKNLVRQNFTPADLGENKAKVLAERYSSVFGMETEYEPEFIQSGERLLSMLRARQFPTGPNWPLSTSTAAPAGTPGRSSAASAAAGARFTGPSERRSRRFCRTQTNSRRS